MKQTNNLSLVEAVSLIKNGDISVEQITSDCLTAIHKLNKKINAFITINDDCLKQAKKLDKTGHKKGRLYGIPFAVKDNFLVEGLKTTAASKVLSDFISPYTATVVSKLLAEGAIVLGKTNLDAWAHGSSTETSDYGVTKNPWNIDHIAGGSSGGSAAAVSSDMCVFSIGSETAASIRGPAAWCGCVGLKPTYGRTSRYGLIAMGSSLDCPGPITKTVTDAALVLETMSGHDIYDSTSSKLKVGDYTKFTTKGIKGIKIGVAEDYLLPEMDFKVKESVLKAAKLFEKLGAKVDYVKALDPKYAIAVYTILQRSEVSSNLARYDGIRYGNDRSYFGNEAEKRIIIGTFSLSAGYSDKYYQKAQKVRTLYLENFEKIFNKFDIIIGPTLPGPAPKIGVAKNAAMFGEMVDILGEPSSLAGLPAITVPSGFINNLPIGLDIIGPQFSEAKIIQVASVYEKHSTFQKNKPLL